MMGASGPLPDGFGYRVEFIGTAEEQTLLDEIQRLEFSDVRMHGVVAKRRVVQFGYVYALEGRRLTEGPPIPDFLLPLRLRAADLIDAAPEDLAEALVIHYPVGAPIGWHRDAPRFGVVIGISLAGYCRMRFRRAASAGWETAEKVLEPRAAYVLRGPARSEWQHHIPAAKQPRYSITFRTLRKKS